MRAKIQLLPKSAKCFNLILPKSAKCCMGSHECYLIFSHHLLGICHFAISGILYAGNKSHLKYRNAIAFDIAESILANLDADDFSLQNRRQERLDDALFLHDALERSII